MGINSQTRHMTLLLDRHVSHWSSMEYIKGFYYTLYVLEANISLQLVFNKYLSLIYYNHEHFMVIYSLLVAWKVNLIGKFFRFLIGTRFLFSIGFYFIKFCHHSTLLIFISVPYQLSSNICV